MSAKHSKAQRAPAAQEATKSVTDDDELASIQAFMQMVERQACLIPNSAPDA